MGRLFVTFGVGLLILVVAACGYLLLQACAVFFPVVGYANASCSVQSDDARRGVLEGLTAENMALSRQLAALQQDLGGQQCLVEIFPQGAAVGPSANLNAIDADAWNAGDIASMQGCWALDSNYSVRNINTDAITHFNQWQICFEGNGRAESKLVSTNGITCQSSVTSHFNAPGRLHFEDVSDAQCSNNSIVFRNTAECSLNAMAEASCTVHQPETNSRDTVQFRPISGGRANG